MLELDSLGLNLNSATYLLCVPGHLTYFSVL